MSPTVPPISTITTSTSFGYFAEGSFDFVGDVRNDLDCLAQVVAAAFLGDDGFVDSAGGPVIDLW